jgi:predicted small secreted protein
MMMKLRGVPVLLLLTALGAAGCSRGEDEKSGVGMGGEGVTQEEVTPPSDLEKPQPGTPANDTTPARPGAGGTP